MADCRGDVFFWKGELCRDNLLCRAAERNRLPCISACALFSVQPGDKRLSAANGLRQKRNAPPPGTNSIIDGQLQDVAWLRGLNIQQLLTFDGIDNDFRIVHVRGGDYFTSKPHKPYVKNRDWYLKAIAAVPDMRKHQDKIILCTDDGKYAKKILPEFPILDVPPLTAFRLMMGCRSLVISASSFGWWAGYLNPSAQIAAPSRWCGAGEDSAKYYGHSRLMFIPD